MSEHVPNVSSRRLGRELRVLRETRRISCQEAAAGLGRDLMWLVQIEVGQDRIGTDDLAGLLDLYSVADDGTRRGLVDLALRSAGPAWLRPHEGWLKDAEREFIVLESEAAHVRLFGLMIVPELLQTDAYAHALHSGTRLPDARWTVDQRVDLLRHRRGHQADSGPRRLHVLLDEGAITRPIGDDETMRGQLAYLVRLAGQDHVVLELITRDVGAHAGFDGTFQILGFADPAEPSVSISQSAIGPLIAYGDLDDQFAKIRRVARSAADSLAFLEQAIAERWDA